MYETETPKGECCEWIVHPLRATQNVWSICMERGCTMHCKKKNCTDSVSRIRFFWAASSISGLSPRWVSLESLRRHAGLFNFCYERKQWWTEVEKNTGYTWSFRIVTRMIHSSKTGLKIILTNNQSVSSPKYNIWWFV